MCSNNARVRCRIIDFQKLSVRDVTITMKEGSDTIISLHLVT